NEKQAESARGNSRGKELAHRTEIAKSNVWIDITRRRSQQSFVRQRAGLRLHHPVGAVTQPRHTIFGNLAQRQIQIRSRRRLELALFHRADNAHDFNRPRSPVSIVDEQSLAERRAISKIFLREYRADQRNRRTLAVVLFVKLASRDQRNTHRAK